MKVASCDDGPGEVNGISVARLRLSAGACAPGEGLGKVAGLARGFELIHAYNLEFFGFRPGLFDLMATRKREIPVPIAAHLNHPSVYFKSRAVKNPLKRAFRALEARVCLSRLKAFDAYIALSEHLKAHYVRQGLFADKIRVIPNMLPDEYFEPPLPFPKKPVALYVGNLGAHKGSEDLVKAFAQVHGTIPEARLRFLGWGEPEEISALTALIRKHSLSDAASIDPPVPHAELRAAYDGSTVLVHPARWEEPFGRDVIEAMARGRPVLASNAGEPPNIVGDPGLVFEPGDVHALAKKLVWMLEDPARAIRIGAALRSEAEKYSIPEILPRIEKAYDQVKAAWG